MDVLQILISSILSLVILFILTKIMGYRQISQLSFFDYVVGITIGSIAAEMATNLDMDMWQPILAMAIYALASVILSFSTQKSIKLRRFFIGVPIVLIQSGTIITANLKKVHYDVNDLLSDARVEGYFNLGDVEYAVMENNGKVSFLSKSNTRPVTPKDLNIEPTQETLLANVVMDGKIMTSHLKKIGKDENWLKKELKMQHLTAPEVFLAIADNSGTLTAFKKETDKSGLDIFM